VVGVIDDEVAHVAGDLDALRVVHDHLLRNSGVGLLQGLRGQPSYVEHVLQRILAQPVPRASLCRQARDVAPLQVLTGGCGATDGSGRDTPDGNSLVAWERVFWGREPGV